MHSSKRTQLNRIAIVGSREMEVAKEEATVGPIQKALSSVKKTKLSEIEFILFGNFGDIFCSVSDFV